MNNEKTFKCLNHDVYGVDWDLDDVEYEKRLNNSFRKIKTKRLYYKPICELDDCNNPVATEGNKPKPYCTDHVDHHPYVQDLLRRIPEVDLMADRKKAKEAFKKMEEEYKASQVGVDNG